MRPGLAGRRVGEIGIVLGERREIPRVDLDDGVGGEPGAVDQGRAAWQAPGGVGW